MHMKMGIMFNWFIMTLGCCKLLKRVPKRVNKAKTELVYYSLHLHVYCLYNRLFMIIYLANEN